MARTKTRCIQLLSLSANYSETFCKTGLSFCWFGWMEFVLFVCFSDAAFSLKHNSCLPSCSDTLGWVGNRIPKCFLDLPVRLFTCFPNETIQVTVWNGFLQFISYQICKELLGNSTYLWDVFYVPVCQGRRKKSKKKKNLKTKNNQTTTTAKQKQKQKWKPRLSSCPSRISLGYLSWPLTPDLESQALGRV